MRYSHKRYTLCPPLPVLSSLHWAYLCSKMAALQHSPEAFHTTPSTKCFDQKCPMLTATAFQLHKCALFMMGTRSTNCKILSVIWHVNMCKNQVSYDSYICTMNHFCARAWNKVCWKVRRSDSWSEFDTFLLGFSPFKEKSAGILICTNLQLF